MTFPVRFFLKVSTLALLSAFAVSPPRSASATNLTSLEDSSRQRQAPGTFNHILQNSSDSVGQDKQQLAQSLLQAVQAEPNQAEQTQRCLKAFLEQDDLDLPGELVSSLQGLAPRLLQPEALILKDHERYFLDNPTPYHPALAALKKIIQDLAAVSTISTVPASLQASFRNLQSHYMDYQERLLRPMADRPAVLHPKAILSGEGLWSSQAEGIRSYWISQEDVRQEFPFLSSKLFKKT